jgi:hypothetical protein
MVAENIGSKTSTSTSTNTTQSMDLLKGAAIIPVIGLTVYLVQQQFAAFFRGPKK